MFDRLSLVVPAKPDMERDAVCNCWERRRGSIVRLDRFWDPPALDRSSIRVYGPETFCWVLAQKLDLHLVSPDDDLVVGLGQELLQREVRETTLAEAIESRFPLFAKPVTPKIFRAAVYTSAEELQRECLGLQADERVIVSEPVEILAEARAFVLNNSVMTCAIYEGGASLEEASAFAGKAVSGLELPKTCVIDVALIYQRGWAVLEFNSTWGAGLNACDPDMVAQCLAHATAPA